MDFTFKHFISGVSMALALAAPVYASVQDDLGGLQHEWERIKYQTAPAGQEKAFQPLLQKAQEVSARYPDRAEPLIWYGIIEASYAGAKGGLGALSLVRHARQSFERALEIDPAALKGSAYTSLGSLYYQVPGWPIGFGNDKKALEFLGKGLAANPNGIDSNYFLGDFHYRRGEFDRAEQFLKQALQAPPRPGRDLADEGRRNEARQLLEKIADERSQAGNDM